MDTFRNGDLVFDVTDAGPADGPVVVLLHGFPQFKECWDQVIPHLTNAGYRCLAPNQRGYSPGARPKRRRDYRVRLLVDDIRALVDAAGVERVHLVGHDHGAANTWYFSAAHPERVASATPIAVPHPAAFVRALMTSRQFLSSWYMYAFQLPIAPERIMLGADGTQWHKLAKLLTNSGQQPESAERDARGMAEDGTLTAAINWYRAMTLERPSRLLRKTTVPTLFIYPDQDRFITSAAAERCDRFVTGPFRYERIHGASHWLPEEQPELVSKLMLEQFATYPA